MRWRLCIGHFRITAIKNRFLRPSDFPNGAHVDPFFLLVWHLCVKVRLWREAKGLPNLTAIKNHGSCCRQRVSTIYLVKKVTRNPDEGKRVEFGEVFVYWVEWRDIPGLPRFHRFSFSNVKTFIIFSRLIGKHLLCNEVFVAKKGSLCWLEVSLYCHHVLHSQGFPLNQLSCFGACISNGPSSNFRCVIPEKYGWARRLVSSNRYKSNIWNLVYRNQSNIPSNYLRRVRFASIVNYLVAFPIVPSTNLCPFNSQHSFWI